ncbi:hypothetical protein BPA01_32250 [Brevibacillus parabrevis]|uniref:Uncharacterized protein n=1 Tax=Brevibacillus parabrevis TaxID=54914 RepID=A0A4Y3PLD1_BREPA|nr:hypothetical protein BPA01_32250 [Brevibacillus parabrevis]
MWTFKCGIRFWTQKSTENVPSEGVSSVRKLAASKHLKELPNNESGRELWRNTQADYAGMTNNPSKNGRVVRA